MRCPVLTVLAVLAVALPLGGCMGARAAPDAPAAGGIRERVKVVPREEMVRVSRALQTVPASEEADR